MQILLRHEARNVDVAVLLVEHLNPNEPLPRHDGLHEAEVEAPNHNDTENDSQRRHDDPILNVIDREERVINGIIYTIAVLILALSLHLTLLRVILFEVRVEKKGALGEGNKQNEQANVAANDGE